MDNFIIWILIVIIAVTSLLAFLLNLLVKTIDEADDEFMLDMAEEASHMTKSSLPEK